MPLARTAYRPCKGVVDHVDSATEPSPSPKSALHGSFLPQAFLVSRLTGALLQFHVRAESSVVKRAAPSACGVGLWVVSWWPLVIVARPPLRPRRGSWSRSVAA